jgi:hypothetical protein
MAAVTVAAWVACHLDPCRLVRQVKQFAGEKVPPCETSRFLPDPCRLVRQVKEFPGWGGAAGGCAPL